MILRSAFWLTVGFMVMAPHGTDFAAIASSAKDQAIGAGSQAVEQIIVNQVRTNVAEAAVRKLSSPSPSADLPMQDLPAPSFVFPRPRPAAMG